MHSANDVEYIIRISVNREERHGTVIKKHMCGMRARHLSEQLHVRVLRSQKQKIKLKEGNTCNLAKKKEKIKLHILPQILAVLSEE